MEDLELDLSNFQSFFEILQTGQGTLQTSTRRSGLTLRITNSKRQVLDAFVESEGEAMYGV
jgi:hypothetical protein